MSKKELKKDYKQRAQSKCKVYFSFQKYNVPKIQAIHKTFKDG